MFNFPQSCYTLCLRKNTPDSPPVTNDLVCKQSRPVPGPDPMIPETPMMQSNWKAKSLKICRQHILPLLFMVVVLTAFRSSVADWNDVPTGSMIPTILEGDRIFVNKLAYDLKVPFTTWRLAQWANPQRGDIVVLYSPADGTRLVKRIVGLPGDTLAMHRGQLVINNQPLTYTHLDPTLPNQLPADQRQTHLFATESLGSHPHPVMLNPNAPLMRSFDPLTLAPDEYFVLGDNRDNSADSRVFGPVPRSLILGRSSSVVLSLNYDNHYLPRPNRLLQSLP